MKIKIIDLLNMIVNDEEVPEKIKWGVHNFIWVDCKYKAIDELSRPTLLDYIATYHDFLKDEVEIIEDKPKEIEKIEIHEDEKCKNYYIINEFGTKCYMTKHSKIIANKLNEIIDKINKEEDIEDN